jgi:hypothetical protein
MTDKLTFFITIVKSTNEVIIQEGNIVNIKIPKNWQKLDSDVRNPALWVYRLGNNSTGIELVRFYPSELVIKKYGIIYRGRLDPSGFNEKEEFYRCELIREESQGTSWLAVFLIIIIIVAVVAMFSSRGGY